jgi:hypothetical protein
MNRIMLDLYSDYLIASYSYTTATGLSRAVDGGISHDKVTYFLSEEDFTSPHLWQLVKPTVRQVQSSEGIILFDDTIQEKPFTDENDLITWHFDHIAGRAVKGINLLSALYYSQRVLIPIAFQLITKTESYVEAKTGRAKKRSVKTKNEYLREMAKIAIQDNQIPCRWILADIWYSSNNNLEFIKSKLHKDFIMPIKSNRLVALTEAEKQQGQFRRVEEIVIAEQTALRVYLKDLPFPVLVVKQVFRNEDGSSRALHLICSDLTVEADSMIQIYQKRWQMEEYHKSLKSNTALAKSPTKTKRTQNNHCFASIYAYFKLELLKCKTKLNHFALKAKLYLQALKASMSELLKLQNLTIPVT